MNKKGIEPLDSMPCDDGSGSLTMLVNKNAQKNAPKVIRVNSLESPYAMVAIMAM